jgi:hypothetical protein
VREEPTAGSASRMTALGVCVYACIYMEREREREREG